ncbi:hypothetical protein Chor_010896 [Crotalus horridus]
MAEAADRARAAAAQWLLWDKGFCSYLKKNVRHLKQRGVVIGYDARAHPPTGGSSKRFARLAATTFLTQGIPVYLFSQITPTPFVVYWENGSQIIGPHDRGIAEAINENLEPWPQAWEDSLVDQSPFLHHTFATVNQHYFKDIQRHCYHRDINKETKLKFVHTSVHGVGHEFVQSAFKAFDFSPPIAVPEQKDPDPEFPTVKYPNPEEGKGVLTLSFALADKEGARIILANDPDADRLAVAEKQESPRSLELNIGYMCSPLVLDKDGISAAVITAEMSSFLATKNVTLSQQLKNIYTEYGYHITKSSYFLCYDQKIVTALFEKLRNYEGENTYPKTCGKFPVSGVRDLTTGYDSNRDDKLAVKMGIRRKRSRKSDFETLKQELDELTRALEKYFFEPEKNKLQPKPE